TSLNPRESFFDLRDFGFLFIIYFVANHIRGEKRLKELLHLLIAITTLTAIYGIGQAIMGMDRVKGPQAMTLTFAGILIIVLSLTWSWLLFHAKGRERWILLFEALILSAALLLTYTRGAWLGLLMGLVILGMFSKPSFGLRRRLLVPAVFLLYISAFSIPRPVAERAQSIGDPSNPDRNIRFLMWKESLRVLRDYPITGVGLVDLLPIYDRYVYPKAPPDLKHIHYGHFHNNFVQVAVQMGLLGLTTFLFMWFNIIRREVRVYQRTKESFLSSIFLGSLAALAAFLVSGLFEYNYGDSEVAMLLFFTIGISLACEKIRFSNEQ
ncbi:O-antigen ligase family protein, partial [candidate division TA06 bacterium]|nr:O-antigen ligase family protein [candidate division TA06 bacterium]